MGRAKISREFRKLMADAGAREQLVQALSRPSGVPSTVSLGSTNYTVVVGVENPKKPNSSAPATGAQKEEPPKLTYTSNPDFMPSGLDLHSVLQSVELMNPQNIRFLDPHYIDKLATMDIKHLSPVDITLLLEQYRKSLNPKSDT